MKDEIRVHDRLLDYEIKAPHEEPEIKGEFHNLIGPLLKKKSACEGISLLFKLLCSCAGVPCRLIIGTAGRKNQIPGPHTWSQVLLNNTVVHVDATWDCNLRLKEFGYCYDYFNIGDREISRDHQWETGPFSEPCSDRFSYFRITGHIVHSKEDMRRLCIRELERKKSAFCARWEGNCSLEQLADVCVRTVQKDTSRTLSYYANPDQQTIAVRFIQT